MGDLVMNTYRTMQGDTWDMIAYRLWPKLGGEKLMDKLIQANTAYQNIVVFPAGIMLTVPDIDIPVVTTLPPWKRGGSI